MGDRINFEEQHKMNEIPDDPLLMPPPYWRGSSAIWHIYEGLSELAEKLESLESAYEIQKEQLELFYSENPSLVEDEESLVQSNEFWDIVSDSLKLSEQIKLRVERTIVMAAIDVEENINMVCVYNLRREMTEIIEKLSPIEKFVILGSVLTNSNVKGTSEYGELQKLMKYRNTFAHGHNTDRPVKSLHHNHFIHPEQYSSLPEVLERLKEYMRGYFRINQFVRSMSKNDYASGNSGDEDDLKPILEKIASYTFVSVKY